MCKCCNTNTSVSKSDVKSLTVNETPSEGRTSHENTLSFNVAILTGYDTVEFGGDDGDMCSASRHGNGRCSSVRKRKRFKEGAARHTSSKCLQQGPNRCVSTATCRLAALHVELKVDKGLRLPKDDFGFRIFSSRPCSYGLGSYLYKLAVARIQLRSARPPREGRDGLGWAGRTHWRQVSVLVLPGCHEFGADGVVFVGVVVGVASSSTSSATSLYDGTNRADCQRTESEAELWGDPLQRCSRCGVMRYCSLECPRSDFPSHKGRCCNVYAARTATNLFETRVGGFMVRMRFPAGQPTKLARDADVRVR